MGLGRIFLFLVPVALLLGCAMLGPPSGEGNASGHSSSTEGNTTPAQPTEAQLREFGDRMDEAVGYIDLAVEKTNESSAYITSGEFSKARERLLEAKNYTLTARGIMTEACSMPLSEANRTDCANMTRKVDDCVIPLIDFDIRGTWFLDDLNSKCIKGDCPPDMETECRGWAADGAEIDKNCGADFETDIGSLCDSIK